MSVQWRQPPAGRPAVAWLAFDPKRGLLARFKDKTGGHRIYLYPQARRADFEMIMGSERPVRALIDFKRGARGEEQWELAHEDENPWTGEDDAATQASMRCRVCGCVDGDCTDCVSRTGEPCHWIREDLCSACVVPCAAEHPEAIDIHTERPPHFVRPITAKELNAHEKGEGHGDNSLDTTH